MHTVTKNQIILALVIVSGDSAAFSQEDRSALLSQRKVQLEALAKWEAQWKKQTALHKQLKAQIEKFTGKPFRSSQYRNAVQRYGLAVTNVEVRNAISRAAKVERAASAAWVNYKRVEAELAEVNKKLGYEPYDTKPHDEK